MPRLITFGCSNTYGHGQVDCLEANGDPGPEPSKFAWPTHLGKLLEKKEVINMGLPGASNDTILHRLFHFDYQPNDMVVVLWTYPDRAGHLLNKDEVVDLAPWRTDPLSKHYYKYFHNDYSSRVNLFKNWKVAKSFFIQMKLKHRMFLIDDEPTNYGPIPIIKPKTYFNKFVDLYPRAADNAHAGPEAQEAFANSIFDIILYQRGEER